MAPVELSLADSYQAKHGHAEAAEEAVRRCLECLCEPSDSWQEVKRQDGVRVLKKEQESMPVPMVRGEAQLRGSSLGLLRLLCSNDEHTQLELDPQLKRFQVLEHLDDQTRVLVSEFKGVFPVANRYFVMMQTMRRVEQGLLVSTTSVEHPSAAAVVSPSAVQGTLHFGGWLFRKGGNGSEVTYMASTDLNGSIPKFVINMVVNDNPMIVRNLGRLADKLGVIEEAEAGSTEPAPEPVAEKEAEATEPTLRSRAASELSERPALHHGRSWQNWAGRKEGKQSYKFGDITRGLMKIQQLKRQQRKQRSAQSFASTKDEQLETPQDVLLEALSNVIPEKVKHDIVPSLDHLFSEAQLAVKALSQASNEDTLQIYAYYNQAICGDVQGRRPSVMNIKERYRYDAWASLSGRSTEEAKAGYCALVDGLAPGWRLSVQPVDCQAAAPAPVTSTAVQQIQAAPITTMSMAGDEARTISTARHFHLGSVMLFALSAMLLARWPASLRRRYRALVLLLVLGAQRLQTFRPLVEVLGSELLQRALGC